jgi:isocitrate dehydrogenase kinase/phosphatase
MLSDSRLANLGAKAIFDAFETYQSQFKAITQRAKTRFEARDWHGMQTDATERLDLYKVVIDQIEAGIRDLLAERLTEKLVWASMKAVYSGLISPRDDWDLAETFFNSVTRRIFTTVGVDAQIEFVDTDFETPPTPASEPVYAVYGRFPTTTDLIQHILADYPFAISYAHSQQDAAQIAQRIESQLRQIGALRVVGRVEMVKSVFYRGKGAYLIGRLFSGPHIIPLVLALHNLPEGVVVDAVLLDEDAVSILFSFAWSYFHVAVERPYDLAHFIKSIIPRKRLAEIYISLGYNKHGKTTLYRDLLHHLAATTEQFQIARGEKGMVMSVFTMPAYDVVFKLIKDRFAYPKTSTRRDVQNKYKLVFRHDRAGRLVDAQEFEHLQFDRACFSDELLAELQKAAAQTVTITDDQVIIKHAYLEREMTPLDIYLREADDEAARVAVIDYGNTIKDLAYSNIFPGDMLLKNFGVTRHGRVIFYDYDELTLLETCNFRTLPQSQYYDDDLSDTPWFNVGDDDYFPEEFARFFGLYGDLRHTFMTHHADLFDVDFWHETQARLAAGEVIDIFPYDDRNRLGNSQLP